MAWLYIFSVLSASIPCSIPRLQPRVRHRPLSLSFSLAILATLGPISSMCFIVSPACMHMHAIALSFFLSVFFVFFCLWIFWLSPSLFFFPFRPFIILDLGPGGTTWPLRGFKGQTNPKENGKEPVPKVKLSKNKVKLQFYPYDSRDRGSHSSQGTMFLPKFKKKGL